MNKDDLINILLILATAGTHLLMDLADWIKKWINKQKEKKNNSSNKKNKDDK